MPLGKNVPIESIPIPAINKIRRCFHVVFVKSNIVILLVSKNGITIPVGINKLAHPAAAEKVVTVPDRRFLLILKTAPPIIGIVVADKPEVDGINKDNKEIITNTIITIITELDNFNILEKALVIIVLNPEFDKVIVIPLATAITKTTLIKSLQPL